MPVRPSAGGRLVGLTLPFKVGIVSGLLLACVECAAPGQLVQLRGDAPGSAVLMAGPGASRITSQDGPRQIPSGC